MGFQVSRGEYDYNSDIPLLSSSDPGSFNIGFSEGKIDQISVNGINMLDKSSIHNANDSATGDNTDTAAKVIGLLPGGLILYAIADSDKAYVCGGTGCPEKPEE